MIVRSDPVVLLLAGHSKRCLVGLHPANLLPAPIRILLLNDEFGLGARVILPGDRGRAIRVHDSGDIAGCIRRGQVV